MAMTPEQMAVSRYLKRHDLISFSPTAALIDMDGTLLDSMPRHADAWYRLMTEEGCAPVSMTSFFMYEGRTGRDTIRLLFKRAFGRDVTDEECEALYLRGRHSISKNCLMSLPMPGADRMIGEFMRRGITTVLVTGSGQRSLIDRLDRDYPGAFPAGMQITSRDVVHGKPHPEPYHRAMERAAATPDSSIAVDNAPWGCSRAPESGAFTIESQQGRFLRKSLSMPVPISCIRRCL